MEMTHKERAARRKQIAKFCRNHTAAEAATDFGVSITMVRAACREHGVTPVPNQRQCVPTDQTLQIIALLLNGTSRTEIRKRFNLTRQRVAQIAKRAIDSGFKIA